MKWLRLKVFEMKWDFKAERRWKISSNRETVTVENKSEVISCRRENKISPSHTRDKSREITRESTGCVGRINGAKV